MKTPPLLNTLLTVTVLLTVTLAYGGYQYRQSHLENISLGEKVTELEESLRLSEENLASAETEKAQLADQLNAEKARVDALGEQVGEISDTVGDLDKLSKLDPELLQKYSKVYFLNEHYVPSRLASIDSEYLYNEASSQQIHASVWPFLEDLLQDAANDDVTLMIISGYRSFGAQASIKSNYSVTYGSGTANQFSADQGYSEHQLGTTVDFGTPGVSPTTLEFQNTDAYRWLLDNAHKYGFVLSYPAGNTYYIFEPWHWRFVGTDLARDLHQDEKNFYDAEQREIDTYLLNIFD
ncbi:MAG: D-alanyl-D-alanine carboxypeptidase family protein [Candidatus Colwellbacteria bacterium]|nr:D-alanyl-D-alanine carboxypeptidase family protein [Candidatus Colwellbacteria bacterium]